MACGTTTSNVLVRSACEESPMHHAASRAAPSRHVTDETRIVWPPIGIDGGPGIGGGAVDPAPMGAGTGGATRAGTVARAS